MNKEKIYLVLFFSIISIFSIIIIHFTISNKKTFYVKNNENETEIIKKTWFKLSEKRPLTNKSLEVLNEIKKIKNENLKNITIETFINKYFPNLKKYYFINKKTLNKKLSLNKKIPIKIKPISFQIINNKYINSNFLNKLNINKKNFENKEIIFLINLLKNQNLNQDSIKSRFYLFFKNKNINIKEIWQKITDHIIF